MARASYTLEMAFSYNTWTDVSADWVLSEALTVERGIVPGERTAQVGEMAFMLHNPDGRYTPGHASNTSGFGAGVRVRLKAYDGANTHTLFTGKAVDIVPGRDGCTTVRCVDDMHGLRRARVGVFPLLVDVTPGDLLERLIARSIVPVGRLAYWRIGHPQAAKLGVSTKLSDASTGVDLDAGKSIFPWAGDSWGEDGAVRRAVEDVCASEGGYFLISADGTPTFVGRHGRPAHTTPDAVLSANLLGVSVMHSMRHVANRVEMVTNPREVGTSAEVLWEAGHVVGVRMGEVRTLVCVYRDADERVAKVGAQSVITPQAGVDFTATNRQDGSGTDVTGTITISVEAGANSAKLTITTAHNVNERVYIHNLQVRGVAMRRYVPSVVIVEDEDSLLDYGRQVMVVDMPLQDDSRVGDGMARMLLANRKDPHPWLDVEIDGTVNGDLLSEALACDVGDRIHVTDSTLALDGAGCFIERICHEISGGGESHRVRWETSPADLFAYWVLSSGDSAKLGSGTRLGY